MPKLIMLSGPSASGKSTLSKKLMSEDSNLVRVNRDQIRVMSILKWTPKREKWIIDAEVAMARAAACTNRNILVDDTNLMPKDEDRWKNVAKEMGYVFEKKVLTVSLLTCVDRDNNRYDTSHVGRPAIERQFLRAGLIQWPKDKQVVIFDIDGTLADLTHRVPWITVGAKCPSCAYWESLGTYGDLKSASTMCLQRGTSCKEGYIVKKDHNRFYSLIGDDKPIEAVIKWAQACYGDYCVLIVSGRSPENGCDVNTILWLEKNDIKFDHIFMRRSNMHGPDTEEKQLILNDILKTLPKERIAFVVDDRPSVIDMWKSNGLRVFPVRGRDDDEFYKTMNELETTHPRPELEEAK